MRLCIYCTCGRVLFRVQPQFRHNRIDNRAADGENSTSVVVQADGDLSFEQDSVGNALRGVPNLRNAMTRKRVPRVPYRVKVANCESLCQADKPPVAQTQGKPARRV